MSLESVITSRCLRSIFYTVGAYLGRIVGERRIAFWADEPPDHGFDPARLIEVDLSRTPSAAAMKEIAWKDVEVDDAFSGPNGSP